MRAATSLSLILLLGLPGRGTAQDAGRRCAIEVVDSVYLAGGPVFRDCEVDRRARLRHEERPGLNLPPQPPSRTCLIAELEFAVDTAGAPELATARVHFTDAPEYAEALLRSLGGWRYRPAEKDGVPVRQLLRERRTVTLRVVYSVTGASGPTGPTPPPRWSTTCR